MISSPPIDDRRGHRNKVCWIYGRWSPDDAVIRWGQKLGTQTHNMINQTTRELEQIFDACGPLCLINRHYEVVSGNRAFYGMFDLTEEAIGRKCYDILDLPEWNTPMCPLGYVLEHCDTCQFDTVATLNDGRKIGCAIRSTPFFDPETSALQGAVLSCADTTARLQAQAEQSTLLDQFTKVNQELKDFAYIVSHDLKAPLRGIKTLVEWISNDFSDKLDEEGREHMTLLNSRVDRMRGLIEGVLQYSRIGRIKEEISLLDLNVLLPEIVDLVAPPDHIKVTLAAGMPTISGESTRISQVFQNLLSNAIKYMDKPEGLIEIGYAELDEAFWQFTVKDNGPGIREEHFERIFRIFQTLVPRDEFESTGVGLTLIKKIVELYGGRVWVESEFGQGSTFCFTYPKELAAVAGEMDEAVTAS